jgi:hypothetical protein
MTSLYLERIRALGHPRCIWLVKYLTQDDTFVRSSLGQFKLDGFADDHTRVVVAYFESNPTSPQPGSSTRHRTVVSPQLRRTENFAVVQKRECASAPRCPEQHERCHRRCLSAQVRRCRVRSTFYYKQERGSCSKIMGS